MHIDQQRVLLCAAGAPCQLEGVRQHGIRCRQPRRQLQEKLSLHARTVTCLHMTVRGPRHPTSTITMSYVRLDTTLETHMLYITASRLGQGCADRVPAHVVILITMSPAISLSLHSDKASHLR